MKKGPRQTLLIAVIMMLVTTSRLTKIETEIPAVEFLTILAVGICCGVILSLLPTVLRGRAQKGSPILES